MVAIVLERLVNVIVLVSQQKQFPEHNFSYFSENMHHVVRSRRICVKHPAGDSPAAIGIFRRTVKIKGIPTQFFLLSSISPLTFTRSSKMIVVTFSTVHMGGIGAKKVL